MIVKCKECGKEYELEKGEKTSEFQCECGGNLSPKITKVKPVTTKRQDKHQQTKSDAFEFNELFEYDKKASRIELFVRIFYAIPVGIILLIYGFVPVYY